MTSNTYNRVQCDPTCHRGYLKANLRVNSKRFLFTTGCKISNPQDGKSGNQLLRYLQPHEIEVYEKLRQDLVTNTYRILHEGGSITRETLLDSINRSSSQLLVDLKRFVEYKEKLVSYQTYRSSYRPLLDYMIKFNPVHYNKQVHNDFYLYLSDKCGLGDVSIGRLFKRLREFFKHTYSNVDYTYIKCFDAPKSVITLTREEVAAFHSQPQSGTLDLFLCMVYTGMRHSDSQIVTQDMIEGNTLPYIQTKTGIEAFAPVNDFVRSVFQSNDGRLPQVTNQVANRTLKKIGKRIGLDRLVSVNHFYKGKNKQTREPLYTQLTCQIARKTFITLTLEAGIPQPVLMKMTGHKKVDTVMKHYTGNMEQGIKDAAQKLESVFKINATD